MPVYIHRHAYNFVYAPVQVLRGRQQDLCGVHLLDGTCGCSRPESCKGDPEYTVLNVMPSSNCWVYMQAS